MNLKKEGRYSYLEVGSGQPIVVLHGLMGGLSNFKETIDFLKDKGYRLILPELPIYTMPLLRTNVRSFARYLNRFIIFKKLENVILLGNSLGGHIGLLYTRLYSHKVKGLLITGSSGLYESAMGDSYPKRGNYDYVKKKTEFVFYNPKIATKELVDEVFDIVNNRVKLLKILTIAKSAIRHNMAKELPKIKQAAGIIWGKNDEVTPPEVAKEFSQLLPNSDLYWIDKCGHAPMMESPKEFNTLFLKWLKKRF